MPGARRDFPLLLGRQILAGEAREGAIASSRAKQRRADPVRTLGGVAFTLEHPRMAVVEDSLGNKERARTERELAGGHPER